MTGTYGFFGVFLSPQLVPFTTALALLAGMLVLELGFALMGGTLLGMGGSPDGPDLPETDLPDPGALGLDPGIDPGEFELADPDGFSGSSPADGGTGALGGVAALLGLGKMPLMIWLASVFMAFGIAGVAIQTAAYGLWAGLLPGGLVAIPSAALAVLFTRSFGAVFARLLPRTETQSVRARHLGRRMGVVTQGTASRGRPAEVRVRDRYGNTHYLRAEPLRDEDSIPAGCEVLVMRHRPTGSFRLISLDN
ncbi:DUF1449 family protein [Rhodovulum sulfidophilum]|uniref:OB-fold-containig protein n=1 Tax=Rhodovulum sulfidophilum TaxID=35806 RepID=UPI0019203F15|nr:OB-fold-containig protein [Rhodovulum sulfidophilum]MBL3594689.1 DUF1449 family protein [Rhodovulum sulfidophilum]